MWGGVSALYKVKNSDWKWEWNQQYTRRELNRKIEKLKSDRKLQIPQILGVINHNSQLQQQLYFLKMKIRKYSIVIFDLPDSNLKGAGL